VLDSLLHRLRFGQRFPGLVKDDIPVVGPIGAASDAAKQFSDLGAGGHADRLLALDQVREEHGRRIPLPDLEGMDIQLAIDLIKVEQQLGCLADPGNRRIGGDIADNCKIGDRVQLVEIRAGHFEEIADHQVRMPVLEQIGQAVKDIKGLFTGRLDQMMDLGGKAFEALAGIEQVDLDRRMRW